MFKTQNAKTTIYSYQKNHKILQKKPQKQTDSLGFVKTRFVETSYESAGFETSKTFCPHCVRFRLDLAE